VLRLRTDHPGLSSQELADQLSAGRDRPVDANWRASGCTSPADGSPTCSWQRCG
jgi:hypothetical protein